MVNMKTLTRFLFVLLIFSSGAFGQARIPPAVITATPTITITTATADTTTTPTTGAHALLVQWKFGMVAGSYGTCTVQAKTSVDGTNFLTFGPATSVTVTSNNTATWSLNESTPTTASSTASTALGLNTKFTFNCSSFGTSAPVTISVVCFPNIAGGLVQGSGTANQLAYWNGTSTLTGLGAATDGQIPIGSTGTFPTLATLTAGTGINVANAAGSITITNTGITSVPSSGIVTSNGSTLGSTAIVSVASGGTGLATLTSNAIYKGNGTGNIAVSSLTDDGTALTSTDTFRATALGVNTAAGAAGTITATGTITNGGCSLSTSVLTCGSWITGGTYASITQNGLSINTGPQTTDVQGLLVASIWNSSSVTFTGYKQTITCTACAAGSKHFEFFTGATSEASLTQAGALTIAGSLTAGNASFGPNNATANAMGLNTTAGASGTLNLTGSINFSSNIAISGTAPTVSSGCGSVTTPTFGTGSTAFSWSLTMGSTPGTSCVITLPTNTNQWTCWAYDITTIADTTTQAAPLANNAATFKPLVSWGASDVLVGGCGGH